MDVKKFAVKFIPYIAEQFVSSFTEDSLIISGITWIDLDSVDVP
jgi:hypothetical protein